MDISKTVDKIKSFRELKDGWDYTRGVRFEESMIERSIKLLNEINNKFEEFDFKTDCFPTDDGEVLIVFLFLTYSLEITLQYNNLFNYYIEEYNKDDAPEIEYFEDLSIGILNHKIDNFKKLLVKIRRRI